MNRSRPISKNVGTASLDFLDAEENKLVWQGTVSNMIVKNKRLKKIRKGVAELLSVFLNRLGDYAVAM